MKNVSFFSGVIAALVLAAAGSALFSTLTPLFGGAWVLRCVVSLLTLAYLLYLLRRSSARIGRVTVFTLALIVIAASLYWQPPLAPYCLLHVGLIWLVRCCYFHNSLTRALADLGFCVMAFAAAVWAAERSGTLFLALWCFFLVQSLVLPVLESGFAGGAGTSPGDVEAFRRARRSAESALRRLYRGL
jgi:hypothetical protein